MNAQITLEATYSNLSQFLTRIEVAGAGEKYLYTKVSDQIYLNNADHTNWKTIHIPNNFTQIMGVSATYLGRNDVNADNQLEFYVGISGKTGSTSEQKYLVINESDQVLLEGRCKMATFPDGAKKLVVTAGGGVKVYGLPGIVPEHDFGNMDVGYFSAVENGTDRGYFGTYSAATPNTISVYNQNYDLVSTAVFPLPADEVIKFWTVTNDILDGSADFKFLLTTQNTNTHQWKYWLFRQNGTLLLNVETTSTFAYTTRFYEKEQFGFTEKKLSVPFTNGAGQIAYRLYKLPELTVEKETIDGNIQIFKADDSYLWQIQGISNSATSVDLYDPATWTVAHSIPKPAGVDWALYGVSRYDFDGDSDYELLFKPSPNGVGPRVMDENGAELFNTGIMTEGAWVSRLPGYANKLFAYAIIPNTSQYGFLVYSMPSYTPVPVIERPSTVLNLTVSPNPAAGDVTLGFEQIPAESVTVELFSLDGRLITRRETAPVEKITLERSLFPAPGLYFANIRSGDWKGVAKIIVQ